MQRGAANCLLLWRLNLPRQQALAELLHAVMLGLVVPCWAMPCVLPEPIKNGGRCVQWLLAISSRMSCGSCLVHERRPD